jgi:hypothetical protein
MKNYINKIEEMNSHLENIISQNENLISELESDSKIPNAIFSLTSESPWDWDDELLILECEDVKMQINIGFENRQELQEEVANTSTDDDQFAKFRVISKYVYENHDIKIGISGDDRESWK